MRLRQSVRLAWRSISGHRLRSALTTLGVVIGIAAVITFVTLGASLQAEVLGNVQTEEASNVYVWSGPEDSDGGPGAGAQPVFTERDVERLAELDHVAATVPYGPVPMSGLTYRGETVSRSDVVTATDPAYLRGSDLQEGRIFEPGEREAVINPAAAGQFDENVSVGDTITLTLARGERENVTVVGILSTSEAQSALEGFGEQPRIYVPTDPFYTNTIESPTQGTDQRAYSLLIVAADGPESVESARENVEGYLTTDSDAVQLAPDGHVFNMQTSDELLDQIRDLLDTLTGFVTGIALISLVVGAIGIANIMLVSVTERTREIGIMKAVGAQNRDVLVLFLSEAAILGAVGAVLGTVLGIVGGYLGARWIDLALVFPVEWFAVAVGVGVLVGIVSGLYPAWRAARTDPIEALRYE